MSRRGPKSGAALASGWTRPRWAVLPLLAAFAYVWSSRGALPGTPVIDDYAFLDRLRFGGFDLWSSMGATYYWRPFSRQVWMALMAPALLKSPPLVAQANLVLLAATAMLAFRVAHRSLSWAGAAMVGSMVFLAEPVRALVAWPSGAQHLLAGLWIALAMHEALARRWIVAWVVAALAVLSHESGVVAWAALLAIAWWKERAPASIPAARSSSRIPILVTASVAVAAALWASGYAIAIRHGVALPPAPAIPLDVSRVADATWRALRAALNLEDLAPAARTAVWIGYAAVAAFAGWGVIRAPRQRHAWPILAAGALAFLAGVVPLANLLPDWNAWRAWVPILALTVGLTAFLARVDHVAALAFVGVKFAALLLATPALPVVSKEAPITDSHTSFLRIVRLERIVRSTRDALRAAHPTLPHHAVVRYWNLPRLAEIGFNGSSALRVWYGDSTLVWQRFGGRESLGADVDAMVEYRDLEADPAEVIEPGAFRLYSRAGKALLANEVATGRALLEQALAATKTRGPMHASAVYHLAMLEADAGDLEKATQLRDAYARDHLPSPDLYALDARLAMGRGDPAAAAASLQRCLSMDRNHEEGRVLLGALQAYVREHPR